MLAAYGVRRLVSSPSVRCIDTLRPYAAQARRALRTKDGLSEEGYRRGAGPRRRTTSSGWSSAARRRRSAATGRCCPTLLDGAARAWSTPTSPRPAEVAEALCEAAASDKMAKGEVLVAHLVGSGEAARVVAVERHLP